MIIYIRYRRGLDSVKEYASLFIVCWAAVLPFVIFQALLCARDDYQHDYYGEHRKHMQPTATETVAPVLILLGWIWLIVTIVSFVAKTSYEVTIFELHSFCFYLL